MRALLLIVALTASAAAQTPATITVADETGVAVPSARVFLTDASGNPTRCQTDFTGRCEFPALPQGRYQLRVEKEGFYALVQQNAHLAPGATIEVTLTRLKEFREVVNVKESPPAIDPAQVAAQETITGLDVINIIYPTTNDYRNALNFIPGVVQDQSGQPHVAGAETYQTVTLLDGFNVTQPANGQLLLRISTDAFRSIQVEPAREPAEDGKGPGGVLNLNTGIGDDHFRFLATDFIPSVQDKHGLRFDQFLPRLTFSGPVEKGKVWFYNALDGEYDNTIYTELPVGQDNDHTLRIGNLSKVQTNLTSRNILTTSFLVNYLHDEYDGLSPLNPQLSTPKDVESAYAPSIKDQHYFKGGELLEAGFAFDQYNLQMTPYGDLPFFLNAGSSTVTATTGGSYYLTDETHARRWQALSNLFLPSHQWHGRHDLKFGVDLDRISYDAEFNRQPISFLSGSNVLTSADECQTAPQNASFPCTRYSTFGPAPLHEQYNAEVSAYAEDRWSITNRLLLDPGVRLDWDEVVRHAEVAPRLAGTYVLDNSASTKISAGIGLLYESTPIFLIARPYAGTRQDTFYSMPSPTCTADCITTTGPIATSFAADTSTLQAPRFLNWSLGLEKKLPQAIYLKAEFMERRGTRGFVYNTPGSAPEGDFFLQNTRDDRYDAFQVDLRHNFRENYTIMGSYTRSRSRSNQVLDFNVDSPILSAQQPGVFPWDTPNRFLSWGYLPFFKLPILHQTELAYSAEARTGFPFSEVTDQQQLYGPADAYRFPRYFSLNLQLEKRFHFLGYYLALRGGFDNITGRCNPYVVDSVLDATHPSPTFSACEGRAFTSRIRLLERK
ncbi:MAG TPA: TonB-dependent receptor [Terriglobales bacterium]|nr:TonB-dependent receptor [Terriglobales bacterium]